MRYNVPFEGLEGHRWGIFQTLLQVEFVEFAEVRLRKLYLHARFPDADEHNVGLWIGRGVGGTATREMAAGVVPKADGSQRDAPFVVRTGFRVEPLSAPGDLPISLGMPSSRTLGPLRFDEDEMIIQAGTGLRILAACKDDAIPILDGSLTLEA